MRLHQIVRRLVQMPIFTGIAVMTLAIGIGATSAIFTVVDGVLLKPLPYPDSDQLIVLDHDALGLNLKGAGMSPFLYFTYRDEARAFDRIGLWRNARASVTGLAEPEEVSTIRVSEGVVPSLGVAPMIGRAFSAQDDSPGTQETVILMAGYWRRKFGADPSIVGRRIVLDGRARDIIGVMPDSFRFLDQQIAIIEPLRLNRSETHLGNFSFYGFARLKPGATIDQARADIRRMIPLSMERFPPYPGFTAKLFQDARLEPAVRSLKQSVIGDIATLLWVLMGTIGIVLLIACANVANLLLVRAEGRQQELAIRAALGARWGRLTYELLLESLTLGVLGGAFGLALAYGAVRLLFLLAPANLPRLSEISIDASVLLFTAVVSIAAGLLFGLVPVIKYAGPHLNAALRTGGRTFSQGRERHRARSTLVVVQVALALVLLVGSGLMIRTFQALRHVSPGFSRPEEIQTFRISIPSSQVKDDETAVRMEQAIADRIAAIPGVSSVGLTSIVPMTGLGWHDPIFNADTVPSDSKLPPLREFKMISPGLFQTLGNTIVAGRDFTWTDVFQKLPVAIVSENLARELWGQPDRAIGKRIRETLNSPWREVVGVVSDARDDGVNQKPPTIAFWPIMMSKFEGDDPWVERSPTYVVRSRRTGSSGFTNEISQAVWSVNPDLPLANVRTMGEIYDASLARTSFALVMLAIAGGMALLLGIAGIYGVISYVVSQRTREIGIRIALGAPNGEVRRLFIGYGAFLTSLGIVGGLAAAVALTRVMTSMLFDVSPLDPMTYGAVSMTLLLVAVVASALPALRATSIDPVEVLRAE